jgi:hypothetical protein
MRGLRLPTLLAALLALPGCGGVFELPTEQPGGDAVPVDDSYQMIATWSGMDGVQDVLLTQGSGTQLFVLFNTGGSGGPDVPRGDVRLFPLNARTGVPTPIGPPFFEAPRGLFNPVAIASAQNRLFVLDQGDTCLAKLDPLRGTCEANTTPFAPNPIFDLRSWPRVREYGLGGGDTLSTFADTTLAFVHGIAAGEDGFVYVAGFAVVLDTSEVDARDRTRRFASRVYRYARGPRYPGVTPADRNLPGAAWHRDTTWVLEDGSGSSSVSDPRGIYFARGSAPSLFIADRGNDRVKQLSVMVTDRGLLQVDGQTTGANFNAPEDVCADLAQHFYLVDRSNRRVLRYRFDGEFIQRLDVEADADGQPLLDPVSVAADDTLAYVADRARAKVVRYKRRS